MLKNRCFKFGAMVLILALVLGVFGVAWPVLADSSEVTANNVFPGQDRGGAGPEEFWDREQPSQEEVDAMEAIREKMAELKDELIDLSMEERQAVMKEASQEILDGLLADGTISQEIYDKLISRADSFRFGPGGKGGAGLGRFQDREQPSQEEIDAMEAIREKMAELKDELIDLSMEERQAAMKEARGEILDGLLADGTISQEIYDKLISRADSFRFGPGGKGGAKVYRACPAQS